MKTMTGWADMTAAEYLKLKRTLVLTLALLAPLAPVFLNFLIGLLTDRGMPAGVNPWNQVASVPMELWSALMLPFLVALQTSLMAHLESANIQWKHLYALPISKRRLYVVKGGVAASLLLLSTVMLLVYLLATGLLLGWLKPGLGLLTTTPEWSRLLGLVFRPLLAASLLVAIHHWVSYRWPNLAVSLGVGVAGVTGILVVASSPRWGSLFPWSLPFRAMSPDAPDLGFVLLYAAAGSLVVLCLGAWDAARRDMV